jgi:ferritin
MKYKTNTETSDISKDSNEIIDKLIAQIGHEMYNHNLYSGFASYYKSLGLEKLCTYYIQRANEELEHHKWIVDYLHENHINFKYPEIPEITEKYDDPTTPFELTLEKELETTDLILEIVDLAQEKKDWLVFNWLMRDTAPCLVAEQREEESISRTALAIAKQDDTWISKEDAILNAYNS